ncbi:MAG: hypothetical protein IT423_08560 [Pirellulaceae bacterium]|nr:hypothetical protein [Pirellulaceae bacterium]
MTFASISIALPLAGAIAFALAKGMSWRGVPSSTAALWAYCLSLLVGVAVLLSGGLVGMTRGVWPREAVDWLAIAAMFLTGLAVLQRQPAQASRLTLVMGLLMGTLIVCRLLYGSVYLRPGHTSTTALVAIALGGGVIGVSWYFDLTRSNEPQNSESIVGCAVAFGSSAILGMSGSFQYGMIGLLATIASCAAWTATRSWPWVSHQVTLLLLGLGLAFAELNLATALALSGTVLGGSLLGRWSSTAAHKRHRAVGLMAIVVVLALCVGLTTQRFFKDVKGSNASYGGYEALK